MKKLKFANGLPELILNGKKITTWRISDDKNLSVDDIISCCRVDGTEFANAKITSVKETIFEELTEEDKEGHEPFESDRQMYETFSKYYNIEITPQTKLKVIKFELIE